MTTAPKGRNSFTLNECHMIASTPVALTTAATTIVNSSNRQAWKRVEGSRSSHGGHTRDASAPANGVLPSAKAKAGAKTPPAHAAAHTHAPHAQPHALSHTTPTQKGSSRGTATADQCLRKWQKGRPMDGQVIAETYNRFAPLAEHEYPHEGTASEDSTCTHHLASSTSLSKAKGF